MKLSSKSFNLSHLNHKKMRAGQLYQYFCCQLILSDVPNDWETHAQKLHLEAISILECF